jgi:hypothetical protein
VSNTCFSVREEILFFALLDKISFCKFLQKTLYFIGAKLFCQLGILSGAETLRIMTFIMMTFGMKGLFATLSITTHCHYAWGCYAECCVLFMVMLYVVMLSVIMQSDVYWMPLG